MKHLIIIIFTLFNISLIAQNDCEGYIRGLEEDHSYNAETIYFTKADWIGEVTKYTIIKDGEMVNFIVAELKGEYSTSYKKYLFCSVPLWNWVLFEADSSGTMFHKTIFDFKCNCDQ